MRAIVFGLIFLISLATQSVSYEIAAEGCRPFVVATQLRDLVAEPVDFDAVQLSKQFLYLAVEPNGPNFAAPAPNQRRLRAIETLQSLPPLYLRVGAILI